MKKLNSLEKIRLIEKLQECPAIKNRRSREAILRFLPTQISDMIQEAPQDIVHITNIVDVCLVYQRGIEEFIDRVQFFEKNSRPMQELDELLEELSPMSVKPALLRELNSIVSRIDWPEDILKNAYRQTAPPDWIFPKGDDAIELCLCMLNNLASALRQNDGTVPILLFVDHLIKYLDTLRWHDKIKGRILQGKLRAWIQTTAKEQNFTGDFIQPRDDTFQLASDISPYLLVILKPDNNNDHLFSLQAWLLDNHYRNIKYLYADDSQKPLEDLPALFDNLLVQCCQLLEGIPDAINKLTIEFCLPLKLMGYDVDYWNISVGIKTRVRVGIKHRVVVRSLERVYDKRLRSSWKIKWEKMRQSFNNGAFPFFLIYSMEDYVSQEQFYAKLNMPTVACLALDLTLQDKVDVLDTVIDAGIPIALWPGQHAHISKETLKSFESLLSCCKLSELPKVVWEQRMMAVGGRNESHLGHSLTLMWDDPDRLPPDVQLNESLQLRAPQKKRGV